MLKRDKMPISFWNYVDTGVLGKEAVSDWKELGMNMAMSFEYDHTKHRPGQMLDVLDECDRQGISVIVCDARTHWQTYLRQGKEAFDALAARAVDEFGSHPAVVGFHVGDEPEKRYWEAAIYCAKKQKELAPKLSPFVNFYPYWKGTDFEKTMGFEGYAYADKLKDFAARSGIEFLVYDCYTQLCNYNREMEIDNYFYNLNLFRGVSEECGLPFWNTVGSVGLMGTRVPTEDDLRWQINTSLAHGCTGIFWFFVYERRLHECFRGSPIDLYYNRTPTFDALARQNRIFADHNAKRLTGFRLEKVYHYGISYGGTPMFINGIDELIRDVTHLQNQPLAVSRFVNPETGKRLVGICNLSQTEPELGKVFFNGNYAKFDGGDWLAPGQMNLIEIGD